MNGYVSVMPCEGVKGMNIHFQQFYLLFCGPLGPPFITPLVPFDFLLDNCFPFVVVGAAFDDDDDDDEEEGMVGSITTDLMSLLSAGVRRSGAMLSSFFSSR
jgi:hypothetical protein